MSLEFAHAGPYAIMHHQCYQMVDILTQYCKKSMGGLSPCALPYAPTMKQDMKSNTCEIRNKKNNVKSTAWNTCEKGRKCNSKNKNHKKINNIVEEESMTNRFSRSQQMVGDVNEVTELLQKVVDNNNNNKNEEKDHNPTNKEVKSYDADKIDESALDDVIQSCAKNDKKEKEEVASNKTSNGNSTNDEKHEECNQENVSHHSMESNATRSHDQDDYDDESYGDNLSDSEYEECPSDCEEWLKWSQKRSRHNGNLKSHSD